MALLSQGTLRGSPKGFRVEVRAAVVGTWAFLW